MLTLSLSSMQKLSSLYTATKGGPTVERYLQTQSVNAIHTKATRIAHINGQ